MTPAQRKRRIEAKRKLYERRFQALLRRGGRVWILAGPREVRALAYGRVPTIVQQQAEHALDPAPFGRPR